MTDTPSLNDPLGEGDDFVATFQIEDAHVRGRVTRLGDGTVDAILKRHDYPRWAAHLLGEAITLSVLAAASLKFDGKVIVQAQGDGPVSLLVAEARSDGGLRGYLRLNREKWDNLERINRGAKPHIPQAIGKGAMAIILAPSDPDRDPYQGIVPLDGASLADCAQTYFNQSEQIPTRVRLAVAELSEPGGTMRWRAGGALLQQVAGDAVRGDTDDDWDNARALFDTVTDLELADPDLSSARLLYRLFHENGVRLEPPARLSDTCTCSEDKLRRTLQAMPRKEVVALAEADGAIVADCQFCGRIYRFPASELGADITI
ncbi:MAG: Hsp33 family molecular chaperone HslO [Alphaproteobacteria bacterium]|nr:Hsp33 family molecular chaperone HslO [Alphaproteobacteria bacterium]